MNTIQFNKLFNYLEKDGNCYIIPKRGRFVNITNSKTLILEELEKLGENSFLRVNINMREDYSFTLQSVVFNRTRSNSLLVKSSTLFDIIKKLGLNIDSLLFHKDVLYATTKRFRNQKIRKDESTRNRKRNEDIKNIEYANKSDSPKLVKWDNENQKKLIKASTTSKKMLYHSLYKAFNKRVQVQHPFLINGHLYYADISIPSLKLIIEVDGGYHNTPEQKEKDRKRDEDFKSIGYTTLRFKNEEVKTKEQRKQIVQMVIDVKKEAKLKHKKYEL